MVRAINYLEIKIYMEVLRAELERCKERLTDIEDCKKDLKVQYQSLNVTFHEYMAATNEKISSQNKFYQDLKINFKDLKDSQDKYAEESRTSLATILEKVSDLSGKTILNSAAVGLASSIVIAVVAGIILYSFKGGV